MSSWRLPVSGTNPDPTHAEENIQYQQSTRLSYSEAVLQSPSTAQEDLQSHHGSSDTPWSVHSYSSPSGFGYSQSGDTSMIDAGGISYSGPARGLQQPTPAHYPQKYASSASTWSSTTPQTPYYAQPTSDNITSAAGYGGYYDDDPEQTNHQVEKNDGALQSSSSRSHAYHNTSSNSSSQISGVQMPYHTTWQLYPDGQDMREFYKYRTRTPTGEESGEHSQGVPGVDYSQENDDAEPYIALRNFVVDQEQQRKFIQEWVNQSKDDEWPPTSKSISEGGTCRPLDMRQSQLSVEEICYLVTLARQDQLRCWDLFDLKKLIDGPRFKILIESLTPGRKEAWQKYNSRLHDPEVSKFIQDFAAQDELTVDMIYWYFYTYGMRDWPLSWKGHVGREIKREFKEKYPQKERDTFPGPRRMR